MNKILMLILGGSLGTLARYFLAGTINHWWGVRFPYGTMVVNLAGCFLMGYLVIATEEKMLMAPEMRLLLMVGFCGAFTTFSTFIFETAHLIKYGESILALANVLFSVIIGFLFFKLGVMLGAL